ncbi:MAG: 5'/3'-nucleotidase SurE [Roseovarius sp.]|nr:5'/3'-nucleotidase SurE [Roseovarius sp.]
MRILITNDDGINARGLDVLHDIASELAGKSGEVWTVAPAFEQSGVGHCISLMSPVMVSDFGDRRFAAHGSPTDCVIAALHHVMRDCPPDLVISGVNRGNNSAENAMYSGTLGAAMEAALQGVKSIALSQYFGPANRHLADPFEASRRHGLATVKKILEKGVWTNEEYGVFYNVNFPPVPSSEVKGLKAARQGRRRHIKMRVEPAMSPTGRRFLWVAGGLQEQEASEFSDAYWNGKGHISVTPMRADLTAHDALEALKAIE